ncbi:MAG: hypothetical protein PVH74_07665 [Desulfobacterales bacterium]|jgi:hypothetical protein|nr:hypothetical protein [Deltaproteobacteria bacterium]
MRLKILLFAAYILISAIVTLNPSISAADVYVYDNNNQNLGILLGMEGDNMDLFIPSIGGVLKFSYDYSGWCGDEINVVFNSDDCSGTPYERDPNPIILDLSVISLSGFYKVDYNGRQTFTPRSYYDESCNCRLDPGDPNAEYYPFVQVQGPFNTPIALPLNFKIRTKSVVVPLYNNN